MNEWMNSLFCVVPQSLLQTKDITMPSLSCTWYSSLHTGTTNFLHKRTVCNPVHCTAALWDNGSELLCEMQFDSFSLAQSYTVGCWIHKAIVFSHIFQSERKWSCCSFLHYSPCPSFLASSSSEFFSPSLLVFFNINFETVDLLHNLAVYLTPTRQLFWFSLHLIDLKFCKSFFLHCHNHYHTTQLWEMRCNAVYQYHFGAPSQTLPKMPSFLDAW